MTLPPVRVCEWPVLVRTPLLPVSLVDDLSAIFESHVQAAIVRDNPVILDAIRLVAPSLAKDLATAMTARAWPDRLARKLVSYIIRMAMRSTPFGAFATVGATRFADSSPLELTDDLTVRIRPDMEAVAVALNVIAEEPVHRAVLAYQLAPLTRVTTNWLTILKRDYADSDAKGMPVHQEVVIRRSPVLDGILQAAGTRRGAEWCDLIAGLRSDHDLVRAAATFDSLVDAGVFICELSVPLYDDYFENVEGILARLARTESVAHAFNLFNVRAMLSSAAPSAVISEAARLASQYAPDQRGRYPVAVDTARRLTGSLPMSVRDDVARLALSLLTHGVRHDMAAYRAQVNARFDGVTRTMPLLELFSAAGVPNYTDVMFSVAPEQEELVDEVVRITDLDDLMEVDLEDERLAKYVRAVEDAQAARFPHYCEVGFRVVASDASALERGDYRVVCGSYVGAWGRVRSTARFTGLVPTAVGEAAIDRCEAELMYRPQQSRYGNVVLRPRGSLHEINIDFFSSGDSLLLEDIYVGIADGFFAFYSRSLGKRLRIRESHVLNTFRHAPPIVRFLSHAGRDGELAPSDFAWAVASARPFLPRVTSGRVTVSRARWNVPRALFADRAGFVRFRSRYRVPRIVEFQQGDSPLLVDLDDDRSIGLIEAHARVSETSVRLVEAAGTTSAEAWLRGPDGPHAAEFVATAEIVRPQSDRRQPRLTSRPRIREGWLFAKLYLSAAKADVFLKTLSQRARVARDNADLRAYYFVRYTDEFGNHIRLRCQSDSDWRSVRAALQIDEIVERCVLAEYEPEYERYGGEESFASVEQLFVASTAAALETIERTALNSLERIIACVLTCASLHDAFWDEHVFRRCRLTELGSRAALGPVEREVRKRCYQAVKGRAPDSPAGYGVVVAAHALSDMLSVDDDERKDIERSLIHMHANRLGLSPQAETLVIRCVADAHHWR